MERRGKGGNEKGRRHRRGREDRRQKKETAQTKIRKNIRYKGAGGKGDVGRGDEKRCETQLICNMPRPATGH